ncbi:MAG: glutathione S-transferase C-terminal domain-containing protein [Pseudomonadota bacterium]
MGQLIDGQWVVGSIVRSDKKGNFDRPPSVFSDVIAADHPRYQPASGRYHLYVSYACPWATRALIMRELMNLAPHLPVHVVHPDILEKGWSFDTGFTGATGDGLYGLSYLYELYQKAQSDVTSRVTVPVLWDSQTQTIVNNESQQIIRILNTAFADMTGVRTDYYPAAHRKAIDDWNAQIYPCVNNGVYRCGFAKTQEAYEAAAADLFACLDKLDDHCARHDYLVADQLTEADIRLIVTLLRFDLVYYVHFKTNLRKISEYPHLFRYVKALYEIKAIRNSHNFAHIKRHYYYSHEHLNPYRIVPVGPASFL